MVPAAAFSPAERALASRSILPHKPTEPAGLVLAGWAQGYMTGAIVVMCFITIANMRRGVLLHKLILLELVLGVWHGTYIFPPAGNVYAAYLSVTALFLNASWTLHNVIAWLKNRPFLGRRASLVYIWSVVAVQPYWVLEVYADFAYFRGQNRIFVYSRPWEALFRDPWWIFTTISLFYNIRSRYDFTILDLARTSPRFGILLASMLLSIAFTLLDILDVTNAVVWNLPEGIDPFWELANVFKLLTDTMVLDDFKSALDRLHAIKMARWGGGVGLVGERGEVAGGGFAGGAQLERGFSDATALSDGLAFASTNARNASGRGVDCRDEDNKAQSMHLEDRTGSRSV